MIKSFKHKGLNGLYEKGRTRGINPQWLKRIRAILARLDAARSPADMDMPGLDLHPLKGDLIPRISDKRPIEIVSAFRRVGRKPRAMRDIVKAS